MSVCKMLLFCFAFLPMALNPVLGVQTQQITVESLIYDLEHPDAKRRKQAAILAGQHRVRGAVPALIKLAEDPDDSLRLEAVRALVRINDTRALKTYIRLTHDPKKDIQEKAIEGLINIYVVDEGGFVQGLKKVVDFVNPFSDDYNPLVVEPYMPVSQDAVKALADLLSASDAGIRKDAAVALGILRAESALTDIQRALLGEASTTVRVELIRAIYKIGNPSAGQSLMPFIRDPEKKVHDEAIFALGRLRVEQAAPPLKSLYESGIEERKKILGLVPVTGPDDLQRKVLEALAYIGDPSCKDIFLNALQDPKDFYRRYGAEGLGRMVDSSYITEVGKKYVREKSAEVKLAMSYALYRLGREEHLIELIDSAEKDQAYFYLLELTPQEVEKLYPYVDSAPDSGKARLLDVIGLRGGSSALPLVQRMMGNVNADVVSAANLALRRLQGRVAG